MFTQPQSPIRTAATGLLAKSSAWGARKGMRSLSRTCRFRTPRLARDTRDEFNVWNRPAPVNLPKLSWKRGGWRRSNKGLNLTG